jgi:16S rRNA C967 or C1407 C5-methylase (RsmB/RsmF family)/NOL1/NOP2/fmu family ribosome biogenesis protein
LLLPNELLQSLQTVKGFDLEAFEKLHASGEQVTSIRMNPAKNNRQWVPPISGSNKQCTIEQFYNSHFKFDEKVPWSDFGYYLAERPSFTFDPLFHAGCYYVQEASGMFLEQVLKQTVDLSKPIKILDLCAAPGGKSTHIQSLISKQSLLVSNEVIRSRTGILKLNIIKWGCNNVIVTNNDPKDFARLENYFDVIVVDAPCSGSGLFRRNHEAMEHWSTDTLQLCCNRQRRILADVFPALKKNGIIIYSTCSYSKEEDEDIIDWVNDEFQITSLKLEINDDWGIVEVQGEKTDSFGYRFFPNLVKGEGFFIAAFRKTSGSEETHLKPVKKLSVLSNTHKADISLWMNTDELVIFKNGDSLVAINMKLPDDINVLQSQLRILYSGTKLGALIRGKLVPDHALAMSPLVSKNVVRAELNYEDSIRYLKKTGIHKNITSAGWQLVTFQQHPLGWVNVLPQRINNYYPKELRILKDSEKKH